MKMQADNTDPQNEHQCKQTTVLSVKHQLYIIIEQHAVNEVFAHELWRYNREGEAVSTGMEIITSVFRRWRSWCNTRWGLYRIDLKCDSSLESNWNWVSRLVILRVCSFLFVVGLHTQHWQCGVRYGVRHGDERFVCSDEEQTQGRCVLPSATLGENTPLHLVSNLSSNRSRQHLFMFITKSLFYVVLFELMVKKFTVIFFATIK